jgi:hypothetical protein
MIWVSLIFIIIFWFMGFIAMLLPGKLPRIMAIFMFALELPLIGGRQVVWTEGPLTIQTVALPALIASDAFTFFLAWTYIAIANVLDTFERDWFGRKRK